MNVTVESTRDIGLFLDTWARGVKDSYWFDSNRVMSLNQDEQIQDIKEDFENEENIFLIARDGDTDAIGVLGVKITQEVGFLQRWQPAVLPTFRSSDAGVKLLQSAAVLLREKGITRMMCRLKYLYDDPATGQWHRTLFEDFGFKHRHPESISLVRELHDEPLPEMIMNGLELVSAAGYSHDDMTEFNLRAYASTPEDLKIHGWDANMTDRKTCRQVIERLRNGALGLSPSNLWWVALFEGEPAGHIGASIIQSDFVPDLAVLGPVGVFPEFRGRGIGLALVKRVLNAIREYGCKDALVGTALYNNERAIGLYEKAGFVRDNIQLFFEIDL